MSTQTLKFYAADRAAPVRGVRIASKLFVAAWQGVASLFAVAPRALTRAQEAAEVREMARRLQATDPGFASDLIAAADRHETTGA